jgi:DNA primase
MYSLEFLCMSSSDVDQIKDRLGIADVVGSYIQLSKAGKSFKARCPFHNEKTPSFIVSPDRGTYHCFGCNKGGDIFSFVQDIEGTDFYGALKVLADRAGVTLSKQSKEQGDERKRLFDAMEAAAKWYEKNLYTKKEVGEYLKGRGLTGETAKKFGVGYAPDEWRACSDALVKKGFTEAEMEDAGLITRSPRGYYDRFRGRIMFPIFDSTGRVVAFSGRVFDKQDDKTAAKYVNSPETKLYNKSDVLYGFHLAKTAIRTENTCILVEGQMDIIMSHQAGVENVVAVSGTALTELHLTRVQRLAEKVVFAFDADEAGEAASDRAIGIALALGFDVQVVAIPEGKDPADVVKEDPDAWKRLVGSAQDVIEYKIAQVEHADATDVRKRVRTSVLPYIARLGSTIDQGHYVSRVATLLGVKEDAVWDDLKDVKIEVATPDTTRQSTAPPSNDTSRPRIELIVRRIVGLIEHIRDTQVSIEGVDTIAKEIKETYPKIVADGLKEKDTLLYEVELYSGPEHDIQKQLDELFGNYKQEHLTRELERVSNQIALAQQQKDDDAEMKLLERYHELLQQKNS